MAAPVTQAYGSLDEMLEPAVLSRLLDRPVTGARRVAFAPAGWSSTDARFEGIQVDGDPPANLVAKTTRRDRDWVAVATHDTVDREVRSWESGLLARLPAPMTHAVVGAARTDVGYSLLMVDVSDNLLINTADAPAPLVAHQTVLDALAAMHAAFWRDDALRDDHLGLSTLTGFVGHTSPGTLRKMRPSGGTSEVLDLADEGWRRLPLLMDPSLAADIQWLAAHPALLGDAAGQYPWTLVHADARSDNLAIDGERVILLDWGRPAVAPPALDLAYWLFGGNHLGAHAPDDLISAYEISLSSRLGTRFDRGWWEPQLGLCLLAVFVAMSPFMARFRPQNLPWWIERSRPALAALDRS